MNDDINKNAPETDEEESNLVELTDEDGVTTKFGYLATVEHDGGTYVVLEVAENEGEADMDDEGEVIILKVETDENGEDFYVSVDDDDISQAVFDKFTAMEEEDEQ